MPAGSNDAGQTLEKIWKNGEFDMIDLQKIGGALAVAVAAALAASPALADGERYAGKSYKDAPAAYAPAEAHYASWTGPYIGIGIGARDTGIDWRTTGVTLNGSNAFLFPDSSTKAGLDSVGVEFNGYAGYNIQSAGIVFGLEGTISGAGDSSSKTIQVIPGANNVFGGTLPNSFDNLKASSDFGASLRGRIGILARHDALFYLTGGLAFQNFSFRASCDGSTSNASVCFTRAATTESVMKTGWILGAGFEAQLTPNWVWRAEYTYADFGSENLRFSLPGVDTNGVTRNIGITSKVNLDTQVGTVGIAYKF